MPGYDEPAVTAAAKDGWFQVRRNLQPYHKQCIHTAKAIVDAVHSYAMAGVTYKILQDKHFIGRRVIHWYAHTLEKSGILHSVFNSRNEKVLIHPDFYGGDTYHYLLWQRHWANEGTGVPDPLDYPSLSAYFEHKYKQLGYLLDVSSHIINQ